MMRGETLPGGIPVIAAEVLAQYGILSVGILGGGLSYTRGGRRRAATRPIGPAEPAYLPICPTPRSRRPTRCPKTA
ncbi:MAG: hypothetical protein R2710_21665 [Acidimicrobiales bacterium]